MRETRIKNLSNKRGRQNAKPKQYRLNRQEVGRAFREKARQDKAHVDFSEVEVPKATSL